MNELKRKYEALVVGLSLVALLPLFFAASNMESSFSFVEGTYVIQAAAEHYKIDIHECLNCQENGWQFGAILIAFLVFSMVFSFVIALIPIAIAMRVFAGWSLGFTIQILLLGRYPDAWKDTNT